MQLLPLLLFLAQEPGTLAVRPTSVVAVPRHEVEVRIDGLLDEPVWGEAAKLTGFVQYEPVDGRPAEEQTEVRVWYSPDAIHFGIIARDSRPEAVRATRADRDAIDNDDHVVLYLDTFLDRRRAYFFSVNPFGVQQDGVRTEGAQTPGRMMGGSTDRNPDFLWESEGRLTEDGWVVEVRIPFKTLRYAGGEEQQWGFQVERKVQRTGYLDTWTHVRRASASFLSQSGTLTGLRDLRRGVVIEAQPFLTASAEGARMPGGFERRDPEADAGLNARLGFTNLTLDATINPDFSQVEADAGQVTVNERFALFFPEKRPFFLEGIELFGTPSQLVYTRRIANPIAGAKLTGKLGALGIAHLTAVDEGVAGGDDVLFNVTRLRRDIGTSSVLGGTFTDRSSLESSDFNRVAAADARIVFGGLYYAEAQVGTSWTRDGLGSRSAPLWSAAVDRTGHHWGFHYEVNAFHRDFEAAAGFVPRTGILRANGFNRLRWYGATGAGIETVTVFFGPERIFRYADLGTPLEGKEDATVMAQLRGGWNITSTVGRQFFRLERDDYGNYESGGESYLPLDEVSGPKVSLNVSSPTFRAFDASIGLSHADVPIFAEGSAGSATSATASLSLRPTDKVRIGLQNTWSRIDRQRDGAEFARTIIPRAQIEVQPSRPLFFRAIAEYRSDRRRGLEDARTGAPLLVAGAPSSAFRNGALQVELLASYEPAPGTVVFLGYGSSHDAPDDDALAAVRRMADGVFLKLAYQFRW